MCHGRGGEGGTGRPRWLAMFQKRALLTLTQVTCKEQE